MAPVAAVAVVNSGAVIDLIEPKNPPAELDELTDAPDCVCVPDVPGIRYAQLVMSLSASSVKLVGGVCVPAVRFSTAHIKMPAGSIVVIFDDAAAPHVPKFEMKLSHGSPVGRHSRTRKHIPDDETALPHENV